MNLVSLSTDWQRNRLSGIPYQILDSLYYSRLQVAQSPLQDPRQVILQLGYRLSSLPYQILDSILQVDYRLSSLPYQILDSLYYRQATGCLVFPTRSQTVYITVGYRLSSLPYQILDSLYYRQAKDCLVSPTRFQTVITGFFKTNKQINCLMGYLDIIILMLLKEGKQDLHDLLLVISHLLAL